MIFGLLGAVGFVLLIVSANVANLTLAKTEKRQQELAVRAALGAGRFRLMRQLLTESLLLACLGGLGGLAVAWAGIKVLAAMVPEFMPRMREIHIDGQALGFTLLISLITGLVFGCTPAWQAGRKQLSESLKQAEFKATLGAGRRRWRGALVVAELAMTLILITGAGLMIESVVRLLHVNPGFDPENLLRIYVQVPWARYNDQEHFERASQLRNVLFTQICERLAALPGVKAVGLGKHGAWPVKLKLQGSNEEVEVLLEGCGVEQNDLFRAMRVPLRAGRYFEKRDQGEQVGTAMINESMTRACWPGQDAVGKRFESSTWRGSRQYEVIGVVGDMRDERYDLPPKPAFYRPCEELGLEGLPPFVLVRTQADPHALIAGIRKELKAAEPEMREPEIAVCRQALYDSTQAQRTYMLYLAVFAGIGLALSALGIYGVIAYSVARRTSEIGIRMALGAGRRQVVAMILAEGARLVLIGVVAGLIGAYWVTQLLKNQLFQVSPTDPVVMAGVALLLFSVALVACYLPARRAAKVDPMVALRCE
jgi:predicted permease